MMPRFSLISTIFIAFLITIITPAHAYEVGDVAYICTKNQKFMWIVGNDSWTACPVRILQRAGGSNKVLAHQTSCILPGFGAGMINKGKEEWVEDYALWSTRNSCENQGKSRSKENLPPKPKPEVVQEAYSATSYDLIAKLNEQKEVARNDPLVAALSLIGVSMIISGLKKSPDSLQVMNSCKEDVKVSLRWPSQSGDYISISSTVAPTEGIFTVELTHDGGPVAKGKDRVLMYARTASAGRPVWAGNDEIVNFAYGKAYFRTIHLIGTPRTIELCPE